MKKLTKVLLLLVFAASGNLSRADGWWWDCSTLSDEPIWIDRQDDRVIASAEFSANAEASCSGSSVTWWGSILAEAHAQSGWNWSGVYSNGDTLISEGGVSSELYATYDGEGAPGSVNIAVTCDFSGSISANSGWWQRWWVDPEIGDSGDLTYATHSAGVSLQVYVAPGANGEISAQGGNRDGVPTECEINDNDSMNTDVIEFDSVNGTFFTPNEQEYIQHSCWAASVSCSLTYSGTYPMFCEYGQFYLNPSLWAHADANFLLSTQLIENPFETVSSGARIGGYANAEAYLMGSATYTILQ